MEFSNIKKYLNDIQFPGEYSIDTDKSKGSEINGYDHLAIRWCDNGINKLINFFPKISNMNVKKWVIGVSAYYDNEKGRLFWRETLYENRSKDLVIALAKEKILEGINRLKKISIEDFNSNQ